MQTHYSNSFILHHQTLCPSPLISIIYFVLVEAGLATSFKDTGLVFDFGPILLNGPQQAMRKKWSTGSDLTAETLKFDKGILYILILE